MRCLSNSPGAANGRGDDGMAEQFDALKTKWMRLIEEDRAGERFDFERLAPGQFCVHITEYHGVGPDSSSVEVTGFFDSPREALAYLFFAGIPHVLDWDSRVRGERPLEAREYLTRYTGAKRARLEHLLCSIEAALRIDDSTPRVLKTIRGMYNDLFLHTDPQSQIAAWGGVGQVIADPYFDEIIGEFMAEEEIEAEGEADRCPGAVTVLRGLLDRGEFDEANAEHLELARGFFEMVASRVPDAA